MLKKVSLLLFFIFVSSAAAEDITIHSKNSDTAAGYVKILIKRLNDQQMQNLLSLENVKALSEVLNTYTDVDYGPQEDLTAQIQTINDQVMASFKKKVEEAPEEGKGKKIDVLTEEAKKELAELLNKLQSVQNSAATRLILKKNDNCIVPLDHYIVKHHWLRVKERILFKICLLVHKCLHGNAPESLSHTALRLEPEN